LELQDICPKKQIQNYLLNFNELKKSNPNGIVIAESIIKEKERLEKPNHE
jgi:hypothetical protein